jgi:hypothetical protein
MLAIDAASEYEISCGSPCSIQDQAKLCNLDFRFAFTALPEYNGMRDFFPCVERGGQRAGIFLTRG